MDQIGIIALLYFAGFTLLIAELFVPSHGLLTLTAMACMAVATYHTFEHSTTVGIIGTVACLVLVPTVLFLGLKYVRYLPMGDSLAPPNPTFSSAGSVLDSSNIEAFIGQTGRAVTPLHPVGICEFNGHRIPCVAESGMIDVETKVMGAEMRLQNLAVRPLTDDASHA